jgi:queuine tRNA-ribosyltransferase
MSRLSFKLEKVASNSKARATTFKTLHNVVETPLFMPVGTHAAVRAQRKEDMLDAGVQILLANTYHLLLRPGPDIFKKFGGIHGFANWPKSFLTDSGGFQIFCLPNSRVMKEDGAYFKSYVDNQIICLSPEKSIDTQIAIGSDIMMVLDQCVPSTVDRKTALDAMHLTHRWAHRSLDARGDSPQALFGIVQGACFEDLRIQSAKYISELPFDGLAIGGLAVGESYQERLDCTSIVTDHLPSDRPRYLMGVGTTLDLLEAVHRGVDMFDCILPTSMAQQGKAFTSIGRRDLRRAAYRDKEDPLDPSCNCYTCKNFSLAYLSHLHRVHEAQAWQLIGLHNIFFYMNLMRRCREHILNDTWMGFYQSQREVLDARDSYGPKTAHFSRQEREKNGLRLGRFEIVERDGINRVYDHQTNETMHSVIPPEVEAQSLYVDQSGLESTVQSMLSLGYQKPLVIWDVGLGAGHNAMAAILKAEEVIAKAKVNTELDTPNKNPIIQVISFEIDLDALRLAAKFTSRFNHMRHPAPHQICASHAWMSKDGLIEWRLVLGDYFELFETQTAPDLIFYDPFSMKQDGHFWTLEAFKKLSHHLNGMSSVLFTYSASTRVRARLVEAGFRVAKGLGTGPKSETTIAASEGFYDANSQKFSWIDPNEILMKASSIK